MCRKALSDMQSIVKAKPKYAEVPTNEATNLHQLVEALFQLHWRLERKCLEKAMEETTKNLTDCVDALSEVAHGGRKAGVAWSAGLVAKASLAEVQELAEKEGLTKIDTTELEKRVKSVRALSDACNVAHEAAGAEANKMLRENCDAALLRSMLTAIESRLIVFVAGTAHRRRWVASSDP